MEKLSLQRLKLVHFKSYRELDLDFSPKLNCLVGNNGVGKTNLFDSIYYMAFCKSFFFGNDTDNIHHGLDFFSIQGTLRSTP